MVVQADKQSFPDIQMVGEWSKELIYIVSLFAPLSPDLNNLMNITRQRLKHSKISDDKPTPRRSPPENKRPKPQMQISFLKQALPTISP